jgi:hypothetical protein
MVLPGEAEVWDTWDGSGKSFGILDEVREVVKCQDWDWKSAMDITGGASIFVAMASSARGQL